MFPKYGEKDFKIYETVRKLFLLCGSELKRMFFNSSAETWKALLSFVYVCVVSMCVPMLRNPI